MVVLSAVQHVKEDNTWVRTVVDSPGDDRRRCSLSVAGHGQTLPFVQGYVTWQLLESRPHVDGQADVLSHRTCCIGSHTCKHTSVPWLCEDSNENRFLCPKLDRDISR